MTASIDCLVRLRHLNQGYAGIVGAGCTKPRKIDGLATQEFLADARDPCNGKIRAELMKARSAHGLRGQPSRRAEAGGGELWMSRTNSCVQLQPVGTLRLNAVVPHQSYLAARNNLFRRAE